MTAVLSSIDLLRKDRHMSLDDNGVGNSSDTDWREKYHEVMDMLSETRAELDDFHQASKELEAELESELQRTERAQQDLQAKVIRAEHERDEWKGKFMSFQTTHNTTTTSLQRELDQLRQEHQQTKVHLRELEMGNDDLERNERAVSSSLADMETKYSKALEEKILLEHELLEKAGVEEETHRLKDELRDANVEISILKDQLKNSGTPHNSSLLFPFAAESESTPTESLLQTAPPSDLDLSSSFEPSLPDTITTPKASSSRPAVSSLYPRAINYQDKLGLDKPTPLKNSSNIMRSTTLPIFSPSSTAGPRSVKSPTARNPPAISTSSSAGSIAKNKGVQMVSEMRARVRNLEQKIHTRVPRLRMASITAGRQNFNSGPVTPITGKSSPSSLASNASTSKTSWESQRKSAESRQSNDSSSENYSKNGDSSGWVLIMEDSPSPQKNKRAKDKQRLSIPSAPTSFRPAASTVVRPTSPSLSTGSMPPLSVSTGLRRPQSRVSGGGSSSALPGLRAQTPTFLPLPSNSAHNSSTSTVGMKQSTGPSAPNPYNQPKRSSLGKSPTIPVPPLPSGIRERPTTIPYTGSPVVKPGLFSPTGSKALPKLPDDLRANVTVRPSSRLPASASGTSMLSKSRIGRPNGGASSRRSSGGENNILDILDLQPRSGNSTTTTN